ncbi:hypothetical protein [Paenibacillus senegalensis]|uniref:hypothetical protein n=1 Tax=Paenibacillus senegalensis TaxID=1465766 RepID=UPI0002882A3C|nr:hypothetical protein [Paenibacillus senegalensis]
MEAQRVDRLQAIIEELANTKGAKKLALEQTARIIHRLDSFSSECKECNQFFIQLEEHIAQLAGRGDQLTKHDVKEHTQLINHLTSHLKERHNLVPKGYYIGMYMAFGVSFGLLFGMLLFDNIALGLPIGMGIGLAMGSGMDEKVKKEGRVL